MSAWSFTLAEHALVAYHHHHHHTPSSYPQTIFFVNPNKSTLPRQAADEQSWVLLLVQSERENSNPYLFRSRSLYHFLLPRIKFGFSSLVYSYLSKPWTHQLPFQPLASFFLGLLLLPFWSWFLASFKVLCVHYHFLPLGVLAEQLAPSCISVQQRFRPRSFFLIL